MVEQAALWWWVAAAVDTPPAAWTQLGQYGVLGIAVMVLGWVVMRLWRWGTERSERALERETARADRLEREKNDQTQIMQDRVLPTVLAAVEAIKECTELLRDQRDRERDYARRRRDGGSG